MDTELLPILRPIIIPNNDIFSFRNNASSVKKNKNLLSHYLEGQQKRYDISSSFLIVKHMIKRCKKKKITSTKKVIMKIVGKK